MSSKVGWIFRLLEFSFERNRAVCFGRTLKYCAIMSGCKPKGLKLYVVNLTHTLDT